MDYPLISPLKGPVGAMHKQEMQKICTEKTTRNGSMVLMFKIVNFWPYIQLEHVFYYMQ
jgi:hypothetical protein